MRWLVGAIPIGAGTVPLTGPTFPTGGEATGFGDPTFNAVSFTPGSTAGMLVVSSHQMYAYSGGVDPYTAQGITDSWGLTWVKCAEVDQTDSAFQAGVALAIFAASIPAGLAAGHIQFTGGCGSQYAQKVFQFDHARYVSGNSGTAARLQGGGATSPLTVTLASAPAADEGVFTALTQWSNFYPAPSEPSGFTDAWSPGQFGQPYNSPGFARAAYDITAPGQTQAWGYTGDPDLVAASIAIQPA